jgi:hypothetical protein
VQLAGLDLQAEYSLHFYGPYSQDVADGVDTLVAAGILKEESEPFQGGLQYSYRATDKGHEFIVKHETTAEGRRDTAALEPFIPMFLELNGEQMWPLEIAATIAFFKKQQGASWDEAVDKAIKFKQVTPLAPEVKQAQTIARRYLRNAK